MQENEPHANHGAEESENPIVLSTQSSLELDAASDKIIRTHTVWAICAGAMPLPLFDIAAVTAVQMDALKQLAKLHGVDYSGATGKNFVTALTGSTFARLGASLIKVIPGVGSAIGGVSMMAMSGASTYAVCQVAVNHFKTKGDFLDVDLEPAKSAYKEALEKGKKFAKSFEGKEKQANSTYDLLKELEHLKSEGLLTEEEFEKKREEVLGRL